jgi:hypothetical protein
MFNTMVAEPFSVRALYRVESNDGYKSHGGVARENSVINCGVLGMGKTSTNAAWSIYWTTPFGSLCKPSPQSATAGSEDVRSRNSR